MLSLRKRLLEKKRVVKNPLIARNWWVFAVIVLTYAIYSHTIQTKRSLITELNLRQKELLQEKQQAEEKHQELLMQVESEQDPAWVEMMLMKGLGVVPEGQRKVLFNKNDEN